MSGQVFHKFDFNGTYWRAAQAVTADVPDDKQPSKLIFYLERYFIIIINYIDHSIYNLFIIFNIMRNYRGWDYN